MKKYSILLVDDEEIILKTLGLDLKEQDYEVTLASSGEEAVEKLKGTGYDLIITDLMMDGVDGIQVLKEAKKKDSEAIVLILTAYGSLPPAIAALRLGAADYILKPCSKAEMLKRVSDCLEKLELTRKAIPYENILTINKNKIPFVQPLEQNTLINRLLVYSHDTYGLGNMRRMLFICQHLSNSFPDLSILLLSGAPMIHSFRIPDRLDYIKLPCISRNERESLSVKYLRTEISEIMRLRSDLILAAIANFKPGILLVDKKPYGVKNELQGTLKYLKTNLPGTKMVLVLRDILDSPEVTTKVWEKNKYYEAVQSLYHLVFVLGQSEVFNPIEEYRFPTSVSEKVRFCGYIRREAGHKSRDVVRKELQLHNEEKLILVTPGGGEDGYHLLETYISALGCMPVDYHIRSLIIYGPGMPQPQRKQLYQASAKYPHVMIYEFTDEFMSYMNAADVVISMGGYNTICEILSLKKRAIVVPRVRPVEEQWIRAERMARLGLFKTIHPDRLTPQGLFHVLEDELNSENDEHAPFLKLDLDALPRITQYVSELMYGQDLAFTKQQGTTMVD
jgi:predicted glycosyltransferase/CheY-like chemotaxis protein